MFQNLTQSTNIPVLQEVVQFTQARHEVLAGNVANMNTPHYQAKDLSVGHFQDQLREAIERRDQPEPLSPGLAQYGPPPELDDVSENVRGILLHDGSNVGIEQQIAELNKNQLTYNLAVSLMRQQFQLMKMAISERVNI